MVAKIIREYMEAGNKKLTVPGFGTFMRKDSGEVIFVDLLRKDDGKLRELVEDYGHYSEVEAMALIDRFIFETKNSIGKNGSAPVTDFGTMVLDDKGLYQFDYMPQAKPAKENPVQEQFFREPGIRDANSPTGALQSPEYGVVNAERSTDAVGAARTAAAPGKAKEDNRPQPGRRQDAQPARKPGVRPPSGQSGQSGHRPASQIRKKNKPSNPDMLILAAIIAAVIAILVMIFGLSAGNMPFLK